MHKRITANRLAKANLNRKSSRSLGLIFLVAALTSLLLFGSLLNRSMDSGLKNLADRLGADVILVPAGYRADLESILLKGEPSSFYLPKNMPEKLAGLPGIKAYTPQLYVATLAASCCSYPVQIIGIEPATDFLIEPWLIDSLGSELGAGEAMVGANIVGEQGEIIHFFNEEIKIKGRLEKTGMGFDSTVFVNFSTAVELAKASERLGQNHAASDSYISCVMIKAKPGIDPSKLASSLGQRFSDEGVFAMAGKRIINSVSGNLTMLSQYVLYLISAIWLISFIVLYLVYKNSLEERRSEMAILQTLGARKGLLRQTFIMESLYISLYGGIIGIIFGLILAFIAIPRVSQNLTIPYQDISWYYSGVYAFIALTMVILVGLIASAFAVYRFGKREISQFLKE